MKHEIKISLIRRFRETAFLFALVVAVVVASELFVAPWGDELAIEAAAQSEISEKISMTQSATQNLEESIDSSGKNFENLWQIRADYIANLGDMAESHGLTIRQLTSDSIFPVTESNNVMALPITLSVQGDLEDISDFVWDLTQSETLVAVEKISYRTGTTEDFSWMYRTFDADELLPWWEITSYIEAYNVLQAENGEVVENEYEMTADDLMQSNGDPICYLELNVIGTGG